MRRILTGLSLYMFLVPTVWANSVPPCSEPADPASEYQKSDAVFIGKVIDRPEANSLAGLAGVFPGAQFFNIQVIKPYKGVFTDRLVVSADYALELSSEYLVYGNRNNVFINTNHCSGTKKVSSASLDLKVLDRLYAEEQIRLYKMGALDMTQAKALAGRLTNEELAKGKIKDINGKPLISENFTWWLADQKDGRWQLSRPMPDGISASASFNLDGSDPKVEVNYSAD